MEGIYMNWTSIKYVAHYKIQSSLQVMQFEMRYAIDILVCMK